MIGLFENTYNAVKAIATNRAEGPVARFEQAKEIAEEHIDNNQKRGFHNLAGFGGIFNVMSGADELDTFHKKHSNRINAELSEGTDPFKNQKFPDHIKTDEDKTNYLASKGALDDARMTTANRLFSNLWAVQSVFGIGSSAWNFFSDKENAGHHLTQGLMSALQMFILPAMSNSSNPITSIAGNSMAMLGMQFLYPLLDKVFDGMNQQQAYPQVAMGGGGLRALA